MTMLGKIRRKVLLVILDGWGIGDGSYSDCIALANTPFVDYLMEKYGRSLLKTDGEAVGLPEGQMGNSEVGHINIGAGKVVYQELVRINKYIESGKFFKDPTLLAAIDKARTSNLHILGLCSNGGIHSHINHLFALIKMFSDANIPFYIHAFTDGRDTNTTEGIKFIRQIEERLVGTKGAIASISGRYYAMDRDKRWERIAKAYNAIVNGTGIRERLPTEAILKMYEKGITDEFIEPTVIVNDTDNAVKTIQNGDVVIFFNFRKDRLRQLVTALSQKDFPEFNMKKLDLYVVCFTRYDDKFENIHVVFEDEVIRNSLGEYLSNCGLVQLRIAETEKYPHVTYFFSCGREEPFPNEFRILVPSPKVPTYDLKPEMSAPEVTLKLKEFIQVHKPDFIILNYANPDMVGHTGVKPAIIKAIECIDQQLSDLVPYALSYDYSIIVTADHGNADYAVNPDGTPNTAHTRNPVPFIVIDPEYRARKNGILADIAPTVLKIMGLPPPPEFEGTPLV